jgi:type IX secretion system PorP/SprF family membrane protein
MGINMAVNHIVTDYKIMLFKSTYILRWILVALIGLSVVAGASAQDVQFSQFYQVPLYQNPAFAGSTHHLRASAHQRMQWVGFGNSGILSSLYTTSMTSVDYYFDKYNSGVGLTLMRDIQGASTVSSYEIQGMYSYELHLNKKYSFRSGLQLGYVQRGIDYSKLEFPQYFNDNTGFNGTYEPGGVYKGFVDVGAGGLFYSDKMWIGITGNHLNTPNQTWISGVSTVPVKFALTGGYKIFLLHKKYMAYTEDEKEISITPTFHYKSQGKSDQLDFGLYGVYDQALIGLWYRGLPVVKEYDPGKVQNNEAIIMMLGWRVNGWTFMYSYDFTVSKLATAKSGGSHEFNLTYVHKSKKKYKPMRRLPCPSFYKH